MSKTKEQMVRDMEVERELDPVRTAAFEMAGTDDLRKVAQELFRAFDTLGFGLYRAQIAFIDPVADTLSTWIAVEDGQREFHISWSEYLATHDSSEELEAIENGTGWVLEGEVVQDYYRSVCELAGYGQEQIDDILAAVPDLLVSYYLRMSRNLDSVVMALYRELQEEELAIAWRFSNIFDFAYSRYFELKQLEDQNRELQVEAALEHVRARALGMRSSDDIGEVTTQLHEQFDNLGISTRRVGIWILDADPGTGEVWVTDPAGELLKCEPFTLSVLLENEYTAGWYDEAGRSAFAWLQPPKTDT